MKTNKNIYEYSSNNSGGSWWLKDSDWVKLEKAGWTVAWGGLVFEKGKMFRRCKTSKQAQKHRFLDALAKNAYKKFSSVEEAIEDFTKVTGSYYYEEGCNCCGAPHDISQGTKLPLDK